MTDTIFTCSPKHMQNVIFKTKCGLISAGFYDERQKIFMIGWTGAIGEERENIEQWYDLTYALECCENNPKCKEPQYHD